MTVVDVLPILIRVCLISPLLNKKINQSFICITSSLALHGPVSSPSTLVAGVTLAIGPPSESPSESTPRSSAEKSTTSTKTFTFQLELLHVQLKHTVDS